MSNTDETDNCKSRQEDDVISVIDSDLRDQGWTRAIIDSIGDGIIVADRDGNMLLFNPAAERILGVGLTREKPEQWTDIYGVYLADGTTPCPPGQLPLVQAIGGEIVEERELVIRNHALSTDISVRTRATPVFDSSGAQMGGVVVFHDITEQKQTMEAMKRAERLISIGTLAAGVAHELNNPVGAMVLTAEDALVRLADSDPRQVAEESLQRILSQAERCSEIVKRVLRFANQQTEPKSLQDLRAIADQAVEIVRHRAKRAGVTCELRQAVDSCDVWANPTELVQVIVNLLSNAIEASEKSSFITLSIAPCGEILAITVEDRGCGIDPGYHERIFDAFYSTHLHDEATGLGLSIAYAIVADHGGTICVNSRPNEGARFTVRIPRAESGRLNRDRSQRTASQRTASVG